MNEHRADLYLASMTTSTSDSESDDITVPDEVHTAFEALLNRVLPLALEQIGEHGEFYPFGGYLAADGSHQVVIGESQEEFPEPEDVIEDVLKKLRQAVKDDDSIQAAVILMNVEVDDPAGGEKQVDAAALEMEHRSGWADTTFVPYSVGEDGKVVDGELWSCDGEAKIFTNC